MQLTCQCLIEDFGLRTWVNLLELDQGEMSIQLALNNYFKSLISCIYMFYGHGEELHVLYRMHIFLLFVSFTRIFEPKPA